MKAREREETVATEGTGTRTDEALRFLSYFNHLNIVLPPPPSSHPVLFVAAGCAGCNRSNGFVNPPHLHVPITPSLAFTETILH